MDLEKALDLSTFYQMFRWFIKVSFSWLKCNQCVTNETPNVNIVYARINRLTSNHISIVIPPINTLQKINGFK